MPTFAQTRSIPSTTPREGSSGVERTFPSVSSPLPSSKTSTSVKVPPTSTATLYVIALLSVGVRGARLQVWVPGLGSRCQALGLGFTVDERGDGRHGRAPLG